MKNKILSLLVSLAGMLAFSSCDNPNYGTDDASHGFLSFANFDVSVEEPKSDVKRGAVQTVDVSNYLVTITNKATGRQALYKPYGSLPGVVDLAEGTYIVKVESHKVAKAEFDHPYYAGSQEVNIVKDKVCDIGTIICKFSSIRVSVEFSEKLTPLLGEDVVVTVSAEKGVQLAFGRDEKRSGYFEAVPGLTTLLATITGTINGKPVTEDLTMPIPDVQAGKHHVIRFKVKGLPDAPEETGTIDPGNGVTLDPSIIYSDDNNFGGNVNVDEDIIGDADRPGQEDPEDPDIPTPPVGDEDAISITSDTFDMDVVNDAVEGVEYVVKIASDNGLQNLMVEIKSEYLTEEFLNSVGMTTKFDLANPGAYEEALVGFHLPVGAQVVNQTSVDFNLTDLIPLLGLDPDLGEHTFILTVIDTKGNQKSKTLRFQSVEE